MSMTRVLANIVTLGATGKVDESLDSYNECVEAYNRYTNEIKEYNHNINNINNQIKSIQSYLNRNRKKINRIYNDKSLRARLTGEELSALKEYAGYDRSITDISEITSDPVSYGNTWGDYVEENLSVAIATVALPVVGIFAAHSSADEKVAEIETEKEKVLKEIRRIKPTYEKVYTSIERGNSIIKMLQQVKNGLDKI